MADWLRTTGNRLRAARLLVVRPFEDPIHSPSAQHLSPGRVIVEHGHAPDHVRGRTSRQVHGYRSISRRIVEPVEAAQALDQPGDTAGGHELERIDAAASEQPVDVAEMEGADVALVGAGDLPKISGIGS